MILDHVVSNPEVLDKTITCVVKFMRFHHFVEYIAEDVETTENGLNSMVVASKNGMVLLLINMPMFGIEEVSNSKFRSFQQPGRLHTRNLSTRNATTVNCNDI